MQAPAGPGQMGLGGLFGGGIPTLPKNMGNRQRTGGRRESNLYAHACFVQTLADHELGLELNLQSYECNYSLSTLEIVNHSIC